MASPAKMKVYTEVRRAFVPLTVRLVNGHITPNNLTVAGLALNVAAAPLIVSGHFIWALVVFLLAGICDMLDGAVARLSEQVTPFGAFLDSTSDRVAEGVVLGAVAIWFARQGLYFEVGAVFVALVASFLVSYTRARAEALGLECKVGLMSRPERIVLLAVGLLFAPHFHALSVVIYALAGLTSFTVLQRILHVRHQLLHRGQADAGRGQH
jgi:CDP-diacylglycerol--glycerol-3-phosphate 3-phosphatidyltransferase